MVMPKDPDKAALARKRMSDAHKGQNLGGTMPPRSEEWYRKQREVHLGKTLSEETKVKMSKLRKGVPKSEEHKQKIAAAMKGHKLCEAGKEKLSNARKEFIGEKSPRWKGGISFEPYCPKFNNEFKERVRAFFGHCCVECGTPQNGKRHHVHHVNFDKMSCCNGTEPLFVPLCVSCHGKTQKNREHWENHFTEIISLHYGGKCYLSREEYLALNQ